MFWQDRKGTAAAIIGVVTVMLAMMLFALAFDTAFAEVLELIHVLAGEDRYVLTMHTKERLLQRHLTDEDVKDILLHPVRVIRRDVQPGWKPKPKTFNLMSV